MNQLLEQLAICVEKGKVDINTPYPPDMKGQEGTSELTAQALKDCITPQDILQNGLMKGMNIIGERFEKGQAFIPELLLAAKAMTAAMTILKPYFDTGEIQYRGKIIIGTVAGDLHDIGKNIVRMVLEGDGWHVIDLGVDVTTDQFLAALAENPGAIVGLSALLTTTMISMDQTIADIQKNHPGTRVYIGGAPLSQEFSDKIGANGYFPDPQSFARHLTSM